LRTILAAIAGSLLGIIIKPHADQANTIGITILIGIIFYYISYYIAKRMTKEIPKDKKKKIATNGVFAFIFMLLAFMVIIFTALNQHTI
jgi:predicted PurR-regulated permease PerM